MIWAIVKFSIEGIHYWKDAFEEVKWLSFPHRHIFCFEVSISQDHTDRDVEFILFKRWLKSLYSEPCDFGSKSCEMIAKELLDKIKTKYPDRKVRVAVSEDNENGAIVEE